MNSTYAVFHSNPEIDQPCEFRGTFPPELCDRNREHAKKVGIKSFKTRGRHINVTNLSSYVHYMQKQKSITQAVTSVASLNFDNVLASGKVEKGAAKNSRKIDYQYLTIINKDATFPLSIEVSQKALLFTDIQKFILPASQTLLLRLANTPSYTGGISVKKLQFTEKSTPIDTFKATIPKLITKEPPFDLTILTKKTELYEIAATHHHDPPTGYYFNLTIKALKAFRMQLNWKFRYELIEENDGCVHDLNAGETKVIKFSGLSAVPYFPIELKIEFTNIKRVPTPPTIKKFTLGNKFFAKINLLLLNLNANMDKAIGDVGLAEFEVKEDLVQFKIKNKHIKKVVLNKNLQRVLGFKTNALVKDVAAISPPDLQVPMQMLYIYSDMVNASFVGGNYKNLLGIIPMKLNSPDFYYQFEQPLYFDVAPSTMGMFANQAIKFSVKDQFGEDLPRIIGPSTLTLEFLC